MRPFYAAALVLLSLRPAPIHSQPTSPTTVQPTTQQITLGQSITRLYGPWKFHIGDSPTLPGSQSPLWADPGFDDSQWETADLTPPAGSFDPVGGFAGYAPGWTATGHPGYSGYAWYRLRIHLETPPGARLVIEGPPNVDDVYQLFANGRMIGSFGKFYANRDPLGYASRPLMFTLPQSDGSEVLAFRVYMEPSTLLLSPDAGGLHAAPQLGDSASVAAQYQIDWLENIRSYISSPLMGALSLLLVAVALTVYFFDRDSVYLWLAAVFLLNAIRAVALTAAVWSTLTSDGYSMVYALVLPLMLGGWLMLWWIWFRLQRPSWMPAVVAVLTFAYIASSIISRDLFDSTIPHSVATRFFTVSVVLRLAMIAALAFVLYSGIRERGRDAWLALPAVVLMCLAQFQEEFEVLHIRSVWFPFGVQVTIGTVSLIFLVAAMLLLLLRRLGLSLRHQRAVYQEMKNAQEVQNVLLPESVNAPGFNILTEYRPAREVGGDFFQVIPEPDGSVLIVVGDVVGKGLQAGMLVAVLVGGIRSTAELNSDPQFVLEALNRRLIGRGDARATCLALRIDPGGAATLANAGHLPPYLNGAEVPMEGALPLGTFASAEFPVSRFHVAEGDTLTFISDGVVEAQNESREMFGFDRVSDLLAGNTSPAALATAAQQFGQEDDISVVSVTRASASAPRSSLLNPLTGAASAPLHA